MTEGADRRGGTETRSTQPGVRDFVAIRVSAPFVALGDQNVPSRYTDTSDPAIAPP